MFVHVMCVLALLVSSSSGAAIQGNEENNLVHPEMADNEGSYFGLSGTTVDYTIDYTSQF